MEITKEGMNSLKEQSKRLHKLAESIKFRIRGMDTLSSNNVIHEIHEIASVIDKVATKGE